MTSEKKDTRRRYDAAMKAQVVAACDEPGRRWPRWRWRTASTPTSCTAGDNWPARASRRPPRTGEFIALPLMVPRETGPAPADIRVELRRGQVTMTVTWPTSASADFAAWTRELLR